MRTIFLADAHLAGPEDLNYRLLLRFLHGLEGNTDTLCIMGDLFDFWLGFPGNPLREYDEVIAALRSLVSGGCRLVYFEGNHDFHLGRVFRDQLRAEIHTSPAVLNIQGRRLFLCHGDQINDSDHGYRLLRFSLHNRLVASLVNVIPASCAQWVRKRLQHDSRSRYGYKARRWDYPGIIRDFARRLRRSGCDGLVTGHFHLPLCEQLDGTPFTVLSLGDWIDRFTYGEMDNGILSLKSYPPEASGPFS